MRPAGNPVLISSSGNPLIKQIRRLRQRKDGTTGKRFVSRGGPASGRRGSRSWMAGRGSRLCARATNQRLRSPVIKTIPPRKTLCGRECSAFHFPERKRESVGNTGPSPATGYGPRPSLADEFPLGDSDRRPSRPRRRRHRATHLGCRRSRWTVPLGWRRRSISPFGGPSRYGNDLRIISTPFASFLAWAHYHRYRLIGSSAHATTDYRSLRWDGTPTIMLLGNEQKGLSDEHQQACDVVVVIPVRGRASSLNPAIAAGLLLYQLQPE